ncbi:MAG: T9SS type B sorting domain-containing protein [Crocinitomicaceae bacterium]
MQKIIVFIIAILALELSVFAQDEIWMHPNRGQWHENIEYKVKIPGGEMYLEKNGFTYDLNNLGDLYDKAHHHDGHEDGKKVEEENIKGHVVKTTFVNANPFPIFEELGTADFYENYLIGSDSTKWKSQIYPCSEVDYLELYDGIDLQFYESGANLKYDILIDPGTDPSLFRVSYAGQDKIELNEAGELVIHTSMGTITEGTPIAYQNINKIKRKIACTYVLKGNEMHFEFPEGYDPAYELIIDPDLSFSTFTGAASDNWGMTACPDKNKNLIAGGIVFGSSYPTTSGAYDTSFNTGEVDVVLTKFNSDGSNLIFSTFLGGSASETPHSLIVNNNNELYVLGATASLDFPTSANPYQASHVGGSSTVVNGISFVNGTDIFISKLSATGTTLLASTYYGGTSTDGISDASGTIAFNYGDQLRGEVMIDEQSNVYISSTTQSSNIPIQGGSQAALSGTQDAIVAKFNPNLSNLLWSSYLGGSGLESGNSVQLSSTGDIVVAGGTTSSNFPNTSGHLNPTFRGGTTDGFVVKYPAPTYNNPIATYVGTSDYDQAYFVQLDLDDYIYVYGQTRGDYTITSGTYNNPSSGQFIHKLSNNLNTTEWSSTFGAGSGNEELSPTAFLVSDCYEIYIAGWGGVTNSSNSSAINSSSLGMPVTSDAYQSSTNGSNFYLALFSKDMATLKYGTFMGSQTGSNDHVDGGTSRFDKGGGVYHAVCAACGGNTNGFPTTPGVYSQTNNSGNCNMAAFLFELSNIEATLSAASPTVCIPDPVDFINDSQNGDTYFWDFGDGNTSTAFEPSHNYQNPGDYTVMLVVSDATGCFLPDTAYIDVSIQLFQGQAGTMSDTICPGTSVELFATGGDSYSWGPAHLLDDPSNSNPIATIWEETTFIVDVQSICGSSQVEVTVFVFGANANASPDTAICAGDSTQLSVGGGVSYNWTPPESLSDANIGNPYASPALTTDYIVEIITPEGCIIHDTVEVWVDQDIPYPLLKDEISICRGESEQIIAGGATSYQWSPDYHISATNVYNPFVSPDIDTTYHVSFTNACGVSYDSVHVNVIVVEGEVNPDTTICPEGEAVLSASGGIHYKWTPTTHLTSPNSATTIARPNFNTTYQVIITDEFGCKDTQETHVYLYPSPSITVSPAIYGVVGDSIQISANGDGMISWSPVYNISCINCNEPFVWPREEFVYTATITDVNGCQNTADVPIFFDPLIFVPNAFTPNGDQFNNTFKVEALNIIDFEMLIFNRWGELVTTLNSPDQSWNGTYHGNLVQDDVYVWQIHYTDINEISHVLRGHVTVLK